MRFYDSSKSIIGCFVKTKSEAHTSISRTSMIGSFVCNVVLLFVVGSSRAAADEEANRCNSRCC